MKFNHIWYAIVLHIMQLKTMVHVHSVYTIDSISVNLRNTEYVYRYDVTLTSIGIKLSN